MRRKTWRHVKTKTATTKRNKMTAEAVKIRQRNTKQPHKETNIQREMLSNKRSQKTTSDSLSAWTSCTHLGGTGAFCMSVPKGHLSHNPSMCLVEDFSSACSLLALLSSLNPISTETQLWPWGRKSIYSSGCAGTSTRPQPRTPMHEYLHRNPAFLPPSVNRR